MILLIDNYDSFTYNIYQLIKEMGHAVVVIRNDEITLSDIEAMAPRRIIISPGPGRPEDAGICISAIKKFAGSIPILGVCLGHQAIAVSFGGEVVQAGRICHGIVDDVHHQHRGVFRNLSNPLTQTRYHSLAVKRETLPDCLEITAESGDGEIMGLRHKTLSVEGVQFHPESIASHEGRALLANFLEDREGVVVKNAIQKVMKGQDLTEAEAEEIMETIALGEADPIQAGSLLCLLRAKGESPDEIAGFAQVLRRRASVIPYSGDSPLVDTCGTGGDGSGTFNISTAAALVGAGAGLKIAKHGNRSITSKCGSADVLESLGMNLDRPIPQLSDQLDNIGFAFLFAPALHPAMKNAVPIRRALGVRTVFNILGPMTNPAGAKIQIMGVFDSDYTEIIAQVLGRLGVERALVVHGSDGLDEITLTGPTKISELKDGWVRTYEFHPREAGLECCNAADLAGGDKVENAQIIRDILGGQKGPGRDITLLNAGAAIYAAGLTDTIADGAAAAAKSIDSGAALAVLNSLTVQAVKV